MAPAGEVGLAGVAAFVDCPGLVLGAGVDVLGLGVGNVGSVGPAPGAATGLPSMLELQPETGVALTKTGESRNDPAVRPHRAFCDNRTRHSRKTEYQGSDYASDGTSYCSDAPSDVADGKVLPRRRRFGGPMRAATIP